jgi:hypothetical protein
VILVYPALFERPIILAVVNDLMNGSQYLVPMLLDTGADQTCFPASLAVFFGHNNNHCDVERDTCQGIGGSSVSYLHSVQISLIHPKKSTKEKPVIAWTAKNTKTAFVENLDCGFGLIGMDIMKQWKSITFEPNHFVTMIRISL